MEISLDKNDRVSITLTNGKIYKGNVKNFSETLQRLSLNNITEHPGDVQIEGTRHFEVTEIARVNIVEESDSSASSTQSDTNTEDNNNGQEYENEYDISCLTDRRKISQTEYLKILELQNSFSFYNNPSSSDLESAISQIQECDVIGLCGKDDTKGRSRRLSVISISTKDCIYIFDLMRLGDVVFNKGLRQVLESERTKKIVHDCRLLSDSLFHQHQTKLVNVRDIEAEDIMVLLQERGCIRKHSRPLSYLTEIYLGIPRECLDEIDLTESWSNRPLDPKYTEYLAIYSSYLIPVHETIERQYLQRLIDASRIYNEYTRDCDMLDYVVQDYNCVLQTELQNIVKYKTICRGKKKKDNNTP